MGDSGNGLHLSGIVLAVLVLASWMLQSPPLAPSRPGHGDQLRDRGNSFEDVPARLWQDPFEAVQRFRDRQQSNIAVQADGGSSIPVIQTSEHDPDRVHGAGDLSRYLAHACSPLAPSAGPSPTDSCLKAGKPITILPIMISTAPYAEDKEHRLRTRAAVIAGLANNKIFPLDGSHIGYWFQPSHADPNGIPVPDAVFPYELYQGTQRTVLLLWLPTRHFAREPIARLAALSQRLRSAGALPAEGELQPGTLSVLGPQDSDSLARLARDAMRWSGKRPDTALPDDAPDGSGSAGDKPLWLAALAGMELFAATPTAPAAYLVNQQCDAADPRCYETAESGLAQGFADLHIRLIRSIATDERIAAALVHELALRGADPACPDGRAYPRPDCRDQQDTDGPYAGHRDHVVLISEADTSFGRNLPRLFEAEVVARMQSEDRLRLKRLEQGSLPWIHRYGYLRGVDGDLPNTEDKQKAPRGTSLQDLSRLDQAALEPAIGTSQFDYLRRLADQVQALDHRLRDSGQGRVRAIGVLGNDVYDKLLILQAMRAHFPNHLFFTNDLDARYLNPDDYRWTRNLVIASSFGLDLDPGWQGLVPPMRGSYQTSLFLATQLALRLADTARNSDGLRKRLSVRLFEVARGRFVDLGPYDREDQSPLLDRQGEPLSRLYPAPYTAPPIPPQWPWLASIVALGTALLFLLASPLRVHFWGSENRANQIWGGVWTMVALGLLGASYRWMISQPEPLLWAGGASIWPSVLIHELCAILSVLFLWLAVRGTWISDRDIARRFGLEPHREDSPRTFDAVRAYLRDHGLAVLLVPLRCCSWTQVKRAFVMLAWYDRAGRGHHQESIAGLWQRYRGHALPSRRFIRAGTMVLLLWVISWIALVFVQPMQIPYRGASAFDFVFWFGMGPLALTFGLLLFWVLDESRLCSALIHHICRSDHSWPGVERFVDEQLAKARWGRGPEVAEGEDEAAARRDSIIQLERKRRTVDFIARRTDPAGNLIWYPFIILILLLISLSTRFDNYDTKTSVIGLLGATIAIALSSAYMLRRTANKVRREIVAQLRAELLTQKSTEARTEPEQVEVLIKQIEDIHQGAFRPWHQEPLVRGLVWVGSMAAVILTEYATVSG